MPTYDYHCKKCKKDFSVIRSLKEHEKGKAACPKCESRRQVAQLVSNFTTITSRKS